MNISHENVSMRFSGMINRFYIEAHNEYMMTFPIRIE